MASKFRKLLKRSAPSAKKLTPQFVAKSKTLTKLGNASIAQRAIKQNSSIAKAKSWSDTNAMRQNLRAQHETQTTPYSRTSDKIYRRDRMPPGAERDALTEEINKSTLTRGHIGIAIGGAAVGGAAGSALSTGNKALNAGDAAAAVRDNPTPADAPFSSVDTWPDPSYLPDVSQQIYRQRPVGAPISQQRQRPGLLSGLVGFLHRILVPAPSQSRGYVSQPPASPMDSSRIPMLPASPMDSSRLTIRPASPMDSSRFPNLRYTYTS